MTGTLSLWGIYQENQSVLDELHYPEGMDEETLKSNLLLETAELEILYSDPAFLKYSIGVWSAKELPTWQRLYNASELEYNPIENYDRKEDWTGSENNSRNIENEGTTHTTGENRENNIHYEYGYNSGSNVAQYSDQRTSVPNTTTTAENTGEESEVRQNEKSGRIHGNIGVKTTQSMLLEEFSLAPKINMYAHIIECFKLRFCLLVYS